MGGTDDSLDLNLGLRHLLVMERKRRKWTQYEAADWFGIIQSSYSRWESGLNRPGADQFARVAEFLGITAKEVGRMKYQLDEDLSPGETHALLHALERRIETAETVSERQAVAIDRLTEVVMGLVEGREANRIGPPEFRSDLGRRQEPPPPAPN